MYFIGIDLAWTYKNDTGIAVIKGDANTAELCHYSTLSSDDDILNCINKIVGNDDALIAIDAPLIVPNESGCRKVEKQVSQIFWKYNAYARSSNRDSFFKTYNTIRGEELAKKLEANNFQHSPYIKQFEDQRKFFEVYPHPSMVVLFNLNRILHYKEKRGRSYEERWMEFKRYQDYLKSLCQANPSLISDDIFEKDVEGLKGNALKTYEDTLDAIFCSYIAYYAWVNPQNCDVLGDVDEGYMLTPIFSNMMK